MLKNRKLLIGGIAAVAVLAIVGLVFAFVFIGKQEVSTDEPVDLVNEFYRSWLTAEQATSTDPYQAGLAKWPYLSKDLRAKIKDAQGVEGGVDPVLCQSVVPENYALRIVSQTEGESEMLVTARRSTSTEQAIVTVLALNGGWYINDIRCSPGEFGEEREFSFDREGNLLKSVPAPLNAEYWHLIFEQNGEKGHYVPLFFSAESTCVATDGSTSICVPDTFVDASKARVQGQMSDLGVNVTRLELR